MSGYAPFSTRARFYASRPSGFSTENGADTFVEATLEVAEQYQAVVEKLRKAGALKSLSNMKTDLLTDKEKGQYSLQRAIRVAAERRKGETIKGCFEAEISDTIASTIKTAPQGFFVPLECMARKDVNATFFTQGGALTNGVIMDPMAALRNASVVAKAGARIIQTNQRFDWPRANAGASAQWLPERGAITFADQTLDALPLMPHRLGVGTKYTRELMQLTGNAVEDFVRTDLNNAVGSAIDSGAFNGIGNAEPLGLLNSAEIQTITFAGAATLATVSHMEKLVADANAPDDGIVFVTTPTVREKWRNTQRADNVSRWLWEDDGTVLGRPGFVTKNVGGNRVVCGAFEHYTIALFSAFDVLVNPYTEDQDGLIRVTINAFADCGDIYPSSFCASKDSGAQ